MFSVLLIMSIGILLGYVIRNKSKVVKATETMVKIAIYVLLFMLGISVGTNEMILSNLYALGFKALVLTFGGVGGSVVLAYFTYKFFFRTKQ